ncbi:hypothetical protein N2152v2_000360 [Parachlorella kessleri]
MYVDVYDERPFPSDVEDQAAWLERMWFSLLSARGLKAVVEAAAAQAGVPLSDLLGPDTGILQYTAIVQASGSLPDSRVSHTMCLGGPETAFVRAFARAAEQLQGRVALHWGTAATRIDLADRRLWVRRRKGSTSSGSSHWQERERRYTHGDRECGLQQPDVEQQPQQGQEAGEGPGEEEEEEVQYDLLVGADDWNSKVRQAAEQQLSDFTSTVTAVPLQHKEFTVDAHAELPMVSSSGGCAMWTLAAARSRYGGSLFLVPDARSGGLRVRGHLSMAPASWRELVEAADYQALLVQEYPALPRDFAAQVAQQLVASPLQESGHRVLCSSLHGPSMVLLGSAAHAICPNVGNGLNADVEDAGILYQVLQQVQGNLAALPEQWSAARLADAQALVRLDAESVRRRGRGRLGRLDPLYLSAVVASRARHLLRWRSVRSRRDVEPQAAPVDSERRAVRYSKIEAQVRRDDAVVAAAATGLAALVTIEAQVRRDDAVVAAAATGLAALVTVLFNWLGRRFKPQWS